MIKTQVSKLLLLALMLTPVLSITTPPIAFAEPVLDGIGMQCRPEIQKGKSDQIVLNFYADYIDGADTTREDLFGKAPLSSSNPLIAEIDPNTGFVTANEIGTTVISAIYGIHSINCQLNVTDLLITPLDSTINIGETKPFTATYVKADGSTEDVTSSTTWGSTNLAVASPTATSGEFIGNAAGSTVIEATYGFGTASTNLGVASALPTLVSVEVLPTNPTIEVGQEQVFSAIATYSDSSTADVTLEATAMWMATNPFVSQSTTTFGTYKGNAAGMSLIGVCYEGICGLTNLTVVAPPLSPEPAPIPEPTPLPRPIPEPESKPVVLGKVEGVVKFESTGQPIANVRIEIHSDPQVTFTDELGRYTFENVPLGVHTLRLLDEDLIEIGMLSVVVGDLKPDGSKLAELELTADQPYKQVNFFVSPLTKEEVVEDLPLSEPTKPAEPEQPIVEQEPTIIEPDPIVEEQLDTAIVIPEREKPISEPIPMAVEEPIQEPEIAKEIDLSEATSATKEEPTPEPNIVEESAETSEPVLAEPQKENSFSPIIPFVAVGSVLLIVLVWLRRSFEFTVEKDGETIGSARAVIRNEIRINIDQATKVEGRGKVIIAPNVVARLVGKTIQLYYKGNKVGDYHKVNENDLKKGLSIDIYVG